MSQPTSHHSRRVTIAIPTFRRPQQLSTLLGSLPAQVQQAEDLPVFVDVLVIDNDPDQSAREIVAKQTAAYVSEPKPGLAAVRNAALDAAAESDALVFVDDDEVPEPGWLTALVMPWLARQAEFVSGRIESTFAVPPDPWIEAGGFFRRVTFVAGQAMPFAATNNLLVDLRFVRKHSLRFDQSFALTGGEDIRITSQAVALGARIIACPDALVLDPVPADRATRQWVLRRAFRVGTTTARCDIAGQSSAAARVVRRGSWALHGLGRIVLGFVRGAFGAVTRTTVHHARGARLVARGAGMAAGAFGLHYREYRVRHVKRRAT